MKCLHLVLWLSAFVGMAAAQDNSRILTNADIINMTKAGMSEKTIILAIQQSPTKFDTTPEALIELKKDGVTDGVLNAILVVPTHAGAASGMPTQNEQELFDRAVNAIGTPAQLASVRSMRVKFVSVPSNGQSSDGERFVIYPDKVYVSLQDTNGLASKLVVAPDFGYQVSGKMTASLPSKLLEDVRAGIKTESTYVAQHRTDYTCILDGIEQIGEITATKLKVRGNSSEFEWSIDPSNGRLLRVRTSEFGGMTTDYADWRSIGGIYVSFKRHAVQNGRSSDFIVSSVEINPAGDEAMFTPPTQSVATGLRLRVLQSESVPYVVETGGGISTNCQISGSTATSMSAYTSGNMTFGNATSTPDLRMICNSSATSYRWQHILNAMLVEASDGNAYIIACDRAWRWSKCTGLKPGDTFNARRGDKGLVVQFFNAKQDEKEATYAILQAKSLQ